MPSPPPDRRTTERRGPHRRRFRPAGGRRSGRPRRGTSRFLPLVIVALVLAVAGLWRAFELAPRARARAAAERAAPTLLPLLRDQGLTLLAHPLLGPPRGGALEPTPEPIDPAVAEALDKATEGLAEIWLAAPPEAEGARLLAPTWLLLGKERLARRAWERLLVVGSPEQRDAARVGLAVVSIRVALRHRGEDARFALEHALDHLRRVPMSSPHFGHALFDSAVALSLLGRAEEATARRAELVRIGYDAGALNLLDAARAPSGALSAARDRVTSEEEPLTSEEEPPGPPSAAPAPPP